MTHPNITNHLTEKIGHDDMTWVELNRIERKMRPVNSPSALMVQICQGLDKEDPSMVSLSPWELDELMIVLTKAKTKIKEMMQNPS